MTIFLDGTYMHPDGQMLDDLTPGRRRRYGVFETMRARRGKIAGVNAHLNRLSDGLKCLGLKNPLSAAGWKMVARKLLKQNPHAHARVRFLVWREGGKVRYAAMALEYQPPTAKQYRQGIKLMIVRLRRTASVRLPAVLVTCKTAKAHRNVRLQGRVKSLDYAVFARAYQKAAARGYDEALLVNAKGHVLEASRANLFIARANILLTPPLSSGCLDGITRGRVIKEAVQQGIAVREENLTVRDIINSDGAFVTNALIGLMPLASIDGRALKFPDIRLALLK